MISIDSNPMMFPFLFPMNIDEAAIASQPNFVYFSTNTLVFHRFGIKRGYYHSFTAQMI